MSAACAGQPASLDWLPAHADTEGLRLPEWRSAAHFYFFQQQDAPPVETKPRIAMFIDADNAPARKIETILAELAKHGAVSIRRAYGNWKSPGLRSWEEMLHDHAIQPIQQFDLTKGKNATDMALTIDAMDTLYTKQLDAFCIVSSDCDFTPLVMRILADGKAVYGFGERKTPAAFVNACTTFLYLDEEAVEEVEAGPQAAADGKKKTGQELKSDTRLMNLLRNAINAAQDDEGWAYLGRVGQLIANQASFDARNYGYSRLGDLIKAVDLLETRVADSGMLYVRNKRRGSQAPKKATDAT